MHRGYTKRWRKRWDKEYHKDLLLFALMEYFIDHANYKDTEVYFPNAGLIPLKRGQHVFGTRKLSGFFGVDRQRIRTKLTKLKNIKFLTLRSTHLYSIATVINYDTYQLSESDANPLTNQDLTQSKPSPNPQLTTPNKDKKVNKEKNIYTSSRFAEWWSVYPKKNDKKKCLAKWKVRKLDAMADKLIADVGRRINTQKWKDGFIPNPLTYINGDRWEDEIETAGGYMPPPETEEERWIRLHGRK
jgi:hypothetical protein